MGADEVTALANQKIVQRNRLAAYWRQGGKCFYCNRPMWERRIELAETFESRTGIAAILSPDHPDHRPPFLCTAEHVKRRADGGKNKGNIVAACNSCNTKRGNKTASKHREDMRKNNVRPI